MNTDDRTKKLALHRETLRVLDSGALGGVIGGVYPSDGGGGSGIGGGVAGQAGSKVLNDTVYRPDGNSPKGNDTVYRGGGRVVPV